EKQRNAKQKEQHTFADLEERDQLEIAMTARFLQNHRNVRRISHCPTLCGSSLISQLSDFPGSKFPICCRPDLQRKMRSSRGCNLRRLPVLPDFSRQLRAPV